MTSRSPCRPTRLKRWFNRRFGYYRLCLHRWCLRGMVYDHRCRHHWRDVYREVDD